MQKPFSIVLLTAIVASLWLVSDSAKVPSYTRRDVTDEQWDYFERQARRWRGLWLRVNATGFVFASTKMQRKFEKIVGGRNGLPAYLQSNIYQNTDFPSSGNRVNRFLYTKTDPPTWGQTVLPNGTVVETPLPGTISFFPYGFGHFTFGSVALSPSSLFIAEHYALHPRYSGVRFSPTAVYVGGKFSYISIAREVADAPKFPSPPWKGGRVFDVLTSSRPLRGPWTEISHCLRLPSLIYERYVRVSTDDLAAMPVGPEFVALRLRDGPLTFSMPVTFAPVNGELDVKFYTEWKLSQDAYLRVVLTFAPDGKIKRHCSTTYYRVPGLE